MLCNVAQSLTSHRAQAVAAKLKVATGVCILPYCSAFLSGPQQMKPCAGGHQDPVPKKHFVELKRERANCIINLAPGIGGLTSHT